MSEDVVIYSENDFASMRKAGKLAAEVLDYITPYMVAGAKTEDLDDLIHDFIIANNAVPATLGYRGYPKSSCISVNHVICFLTSVFHYRNNTSFFYCLW